MGRPPLPLGGHGEIQVYKVGSKTWEARCNYRDLNGEIHRPSARGPSKTAARNTLLTRLAQLTAAAAKGTELTREDRFKKAADLWVQDQEDKVVLGTMAAGSVRTYVSLLDNHVRPRLDALRLREVRVAVCDRLVKDKHSELGFDSAKTIRSIVSGICGLAVRHEALDANPVKSIEKLSRGKKAPVVTMSLEQIRQMQAGLDGLAAKKEVDTRGRRLGRRAAVWTSLPDLSEAMLSTGVRIGELLAVSGEEVSEDDEGHTTVLIDWHLVRQKGQGLVREQGRKANRPGVLLRVPDWSAPMWQRRKLAVGAGPLFPSARGGWLDPSNSINRLREALDETGFDWVTSRVWRRTVATLLDEAGLTTTEIADQLGNTPAVVEQHYRRKRVTNTKAAAALEPIKKT